MRIKMKKAFTLAEVLITLTIIGVIAAITIPNLMQKWEDQQTISGVKQAYAILGNAFKLAIREKGAPLIDWDWPTLKTGNGSNEINGPFLAETLMPYLRVQTYCGTKERDKRCYASAYPDNANNGWAYYKLLNGDSSRYRFISNYNYYCSGRMQLENGMLLCFDVNFPKGASKMVEGSSSYAKNYVGNIMVDINGQKGPNRFGYDVFFFGYDDNGLNIIKTLTNNNITKVYDSRLCANKTSYGESCATWILLHNNMDYKYRDVSTEW